MSHGSHYLTFYFRSTLQCIRTMSCDYALCSIFAPGDRIVIIGTKVNIYGSLRVRVYDV